MHHPGPYGGGRAGEAAAVGLGAQQQQQQQHAPFQQPLAMPAHFQQQQHQQYALEVQAAQLGYRRGSNGSGGMLPAGGGQPPAAGSRALQVRNPGDRKPQ